MKISAVPFRIILIGAFLIAGLCGCGTAPATPDGVDVVVLGIAQDGGVPHLGCDASCCRQARATGQRLLPACLGIHDRRSGRLVLIEATPAVEAQVALLHQKSGVQDRGRRPVDAVLITHAHIGHYLGLAHFGTEVASTERLPLFVSQRMAAFLAAHGPWQMLLQRQQIELRPFAPGSSFEPIAGIRVEAIAVPHRDEFSDTMAFRITGPSRTVLFVPDVDAWHRDEGLLDRLLEGVDIAYVDATFYDGSELPGRDLRQIPHPPMVDSMLRLQTRVVARPGSIRFIHLNHTNPALRDPAIRRRVERRGFRIAEQGEVVRL